MIVLFCWLPNTGLSIRSSALENVAYKFVLHQQSLAYLVRPNTLLNKSQAWHIDGATNKKNLHDFYKVLTCHVSEFEPNRIISLQITVI